MKKLSFAAIALMMVGAIASCTKTQTMTAEPGKAMLTLELKVNNNEANDTIASIELREDVPAGTVVQFVMNTEDLQEDPKGGYAYNVKTWTAEVGANGMVSIELPAITRGASVAVKYPDLKLTKTWRIGHSGSTVNPRRDTTDMIIYERANDTFSIFDGADVKQYDLEYGEK